MKSQNLQVFEAVSKKIRDFLQRDFYLLTDELFSFEREIAKKLGFFWCIGVSNGTVALQLLLRSLKLKNGAKIAIPSFCPIPTAMAVIEEGFTPVLCDVNKDSWCLDVASLLACKIRFDAVIVVHIFGCPANVKEIHDTFDVPIIEDGCQAFGSLPDEAFGRYSKGMAMSFYPTKNLGSWGDAGAVLVNSEEMDQEIRQFRNYGLDSDFESSSCGGNYRMDDLHALILGEKLKHFEAYQKEREDVRCLYESVLDPKGFQHCAYGKSNHHVIGWLGHSVEQQQKIKNLFLQYKIRHKFFYETPLYKMKPLRPFVSGSYPVCEDLSKRIITLPVSPDQAAIVIEKNIL